LFQTPSGSTEIGLGLSENNKQVLLEVVDKESGEVAVIFMTHRQARVLAANVNSYADWAESQTTGRMS
jgi:hypothetical protein